MITPKGYKVGSAGLEHPTGTRKRRKASVTKRRKMTPGFNTWSKTCVILRSWSMCCYWVCDKIRKWMHLFKWFSDFKSCIGMLRLVEVIDYFNLFSFFSHPILSLIGAFPQFKSCPLQTPPPAYFWRARKEENWGNWDVGSHHTPCKSQFGFGIAPDAVVKGFF